MVAPSPPKPRSSLLVYRPQRAVANYLLPTTHCPLSFFASSSAQLLCFLSHPCNPRSFMRLRTLLRNGASRSLLFSMASAFFLSPRGCTPCVALFPVLRCSNLPTPVFASVCRLFVVSLCSFLCSFPLFSMACGLFSENTRVGGSMTRFQLSTVDGELRSASAFAALVGGGGNSHA